MNQTKMAGMLNAALVHEKVKSGELTKQDAANTLGIPRTTFRRQHNKYLQSGGVKPVEKQSMAGGSVSGIKDVAVAAQRVVDEWTIPGARPVIQPEPIRKAPAHGGKWKRFVAASDIHGDMQDPEVCNVLWKFMEQWKPQIRCCLGDVWDLRAMRNGASNEEKSESMSRDFQMGMAWLERFFAGDGEKYLNLGNHDARLYEWAYNRRGVERDFAADKVALVESEFQRMGLNWVPYHKRDGVIKIGHLRLIHGFHCGVYAARQAALIYGSCLMGHTHSVDEHHIAGLERRACRIIGAICRLEMDYNARQPNTLRQANGFAYGVINQITGAYQVWQGESYDGSWLIPSDVVEL